jgi:hypothetical protein
MFNKLTQASPIDDSKVYNNLWAKYRKPMSVMQRVGYMVAGALLLRWYQHDHALVHGALNQTSDILQKLGGLAGVAALLGVILGRTKKKKQNGE